MKQENQARSSRICSVCAKSQRPTISSVGGGGDGDESKVFLLILFGKSTQSTGCCVSGRRCWAPIPTIHLFNDTYPKSVLIGSALSCLCNWILAVSCHFRRVQWDRNRSICRVSFGVGVTWKYQMVTAAVNAANHSPTCHFFAFTYSHPFISVIIIIETLTPATHLSDVFSFNNEPLQGSRVQEFTLKFDTMSHCFRINKSTYINI